jgi:hypothetical protein
MSASRLPCAKTGPIKACGEGSEFGARLHLNRLLSSLVLPIDSLSPYTHQQEWAACKPCESVVDYTSPIVLAVFYICLLARNFLRHDVIYSRGRYYRSW